MLTDADHRRIAKGMGSKLYPVTKRGRAIAKMLGARIIKPARKRKNKL